MQKLNPNIVIKPLFLFLVLIMSCQLTAANEEVSICASPSWIPYHWENEQKVRGVFLEIFNQFLRTEQLSADIVRVGSWARCLKQVQQGEIEVLMGAYKTEERESWGWYSKPVAFDETKVFYFEPSLKLATFADLSKYRGAARIGSSYGRIIDTFFEQQKAHKRLEMTYSDEAMIQMGSKGRIDYFAGVESNILALFSKLKQQRLVPSDSEILTMSQSFSKNSLHFVFSRQSLRGRELQRKFNRFFESQYTQQQVEMLKRKYAQSYIKASTYQ